MNNNNKRSKNGYESIDNDQPHKKRKLDVDNTSCSQSVIVDGLLFIFVII